MSPIGSWVGGVYFRPTKDWDFINPNGMLASICLHGISKPIDSVFRLGMSSAALASDIIASA